MKATASFTKPGSIQATISITATLDQWSKLRDEMKDLPYYGLSQSLRAAIQEVSTQLGSRIDYDDDPMAPDDAA